MVFTNLGQREKDAFFSLLDEYFVSRPELFTNTNNKSHHNPNTDVAVAASSAVRDVVVKHPEATAKFMTAGLKHFAAANNADKSNNRPLVSGSSGISGGGGGGGGGGGVGESSESGESTSISGRVAAAQALFSGKHNPFASKVASGNTNTPTQSSTPSSSPAFKSSTFAPPPIRRAPSSAGSTRQPPPPAKEPEEEGEWVEALYDYNSGEAGDLKVEEGQRILLIERTSDDWWTGELNGKKGLFPASYVKVL